MEDYQAKDNALTKKSIVLLERMLTEFQRLKVERILDTTLCRTLDYFGSQLKGVMLLIHENPRYDHIAIQNVIDESFSIDKNATGVVLYLDWKDCEKGKERRISIHGKIGKAN
ncbi:hypothetical protein [Polaribacter staleyi]|uniref:hypothetical protein n=1 Tax=Polaribacter staleyi TaxID=2022337 RepID=UPI0031BBCD43